MPRAVSGPQGMIAPRASPGWQKPHRFAGAGRRIEDLYRVRENSAVSLGSGQHRGNLTDLVLDHPLDLDRRDRGGGSDGRREALAIPERRLNEDITDAIEYAGCDGLDETGDLGLMGAKGAVLGQGQMLREALYSAWRAGAPM